MNEIIPGYDCVAEVRRIREQLAAEDGYDMNKIYKRIKEGPLRFVESLELRDDD